MLLTYEAILEGNVLKWKGEAPKQDNVAVYVTLLDKPLDAAEKARQGSQMGDALAALATLDERSITEPIAWQAEMRRERPLPRE